MDLDDWGTLLTVLLVLDILISAAAAYLIAKHHKDTLATHRTYPATGTGTTGPVTGGTSR
jgi:hypothetical protein